MKAYHFLYEGNKMRDGRVAPADGDWLVVTKEIELCSWGLHASTTPWDALQHAPGPILCLVELGGTIIEGADKVVASCRKITKRFDATEMLYYFARMQALKVVDLWDAPDVVLDFLMTGENRAAAGTAAGTAWDARAAAWVAAGDASAAARAAARDAAWAAAGDAAWAASAAAGNAARAARAAARDARDAASAAAGNAAWAAAGAAARAAARDDFNALVEECFE